MSRTAGIFLLLAVLSLTALAQNPEVRARFFHAQGDSVRVEYALPAGSPQRPAVIVLSDRFGLQENVRAALKVLATLGYRAYALPLRSAPMQALTGMPAADVDSLDAVLLTEVAVDIMNDSGCTGSVGLLGFDIGANVAIEAVRRFPFFRSAALFYPAGGIEALAGMLEADAALQLHVAQFDPACTIADVNQLRERFMEARKNLHVFYYKEAHRFFFNPQHEHFHRRNTQAAWSRLNQYFRRTL
ncbi:MAG: dienelactone hydrolase family protein [Bacteroidota bacterium]|nr:dienelactone hydrolase family protein [Bacteroidota bacterium]